MYNELNKLGKNMKNDDETLTISRLAQLELEFLTHFEGLIWEIKKLVHPEMRDLISVTHKNIEQTVESEREKIKQLIINHNITDSKLSEFPLNRSMTYTVYQKKLFGKRKPVIRLTASMKVDLNNLFTNGKVTEPLDSRILENTITQLAEDASIFNYIGIFSPTGWTDAAKFSSQEAKNYKFLLIESIGKGFNILNPLNNMQINNLFDPENQQLKQNRAYYYLKNLAELEASDRVVLIKDISEKCKIPDMLVLRAARDLAIKDKSFKVEYISKSWVIYRDNIKAK